MRRGLGLAVLVAAVVLVLAAAVNGHKILSGSVLELDQERGAITLRLDDGTGARLQVYPSLLRNVQVGQPVQVVVEGNTVRLLAAP